MPDKRQVAPHHWPTIPVALPDAWLHRTVKACANMLGAAGHLASWPPQTPHGV